MGDIIRFPQRAHWTAIHMRFWNASLDRLTDYLARLRLTENEMSDLKFDYPKDAPLMITTRTFDAPRALVWTCFSQPEHVVRWWGPKSISPIVRLDKFEFRVGGKWRFVTQRPDGPETIVFHGTYKDIVKLERIVNTFAVEAMYAEDDLLTETHTFEARGDKTFYRAVANLGTIEARDGVVAGGMEAGARESMAQLADLLADLMEAVK
jgi:uncharacterized protein YndB with AHSA1/START domain